MASVTSIFSIFSLFGSTFVYCEWLIYKIIFICQVKFNLYCFIMPNFLNKYWNIRLKRYHSLVSNVDCESLKIKQKVDRNLTIRIVETILKTLPS